MTDAISSVGVTLTRAGNAIAELTKIGGIELKRDLIDVTNFDSEYREFILGFIDPGEVQIEGNFLAGDTSGQIALKSDLITGTAVAFVITFPTSITATWSFNGVVSSFKIGDMVTADKIPFSATIKVTGEPTLAITASTGAATITGVEENGGAALTFLPTYAIGTFTYTTTVNTASDWIKLTVTAASHTIYVSIDDGDETLLTTGVQSGELTIGAAGTVTKVEIRVYESAKTAKTYTIYVSRPAA